MDKSNILYKKEIINLVCLAYVSLTGANMKVSCQLIKFHFRHLNPPIAFAKPTATANEGRFSNRQSAVSAPYTSTPKYGPQPARKLMGNRPANFQEAFEAIRAPTNEAKYSTVTKNTII